MQHKIYRLVSLIVLIFYSTAMLAQKDTTTYYKYGGNGQVRFDSLRKKIQVDRKNYQLFHVYKDSLKRFDSLGKTQRFKYLRSDSAFKRMTQERQQLYRLNKLKTDTAFKRMTTERKKMQAFNRQRSDSAFRKMMVVRRDSMRLNKYRLDSGYKRIILDRQKFTKARQLYIKNLRTDSLRMTQFLKFKKDSLQLRMDSVKRGKKYASKEISMQAGCDPGTTVFIKDNNRNMIIKKVAAPRVSVATTVNYTAEEKFSDAEWFKKMAVGFERSAKGIVIAIEQDNTVKDMPAMMNSKRAITIEIPENSELNIEANNAEAQLEQNINKLTADITNGTLKMQGGNTVAINGKYSTIKAEMFRDAVITLTNCKFFAENIGQLDINSKYSAIKIANTNNIAITSTSDQYLLDEAAVIKGKKDFGKLSLDRLNDQLVLTGSNTDVAVNTLALNTSLIKIDSKYADLKFPVYDLKNYNIRYEGSSRNVATAYSTTQKTTGAASATVNQQMIADTSKGTGKMSKTLFEASAGNTSGNHTRAEINCAFCNVVFN